jgi:hypothetical protein
VLDDEFTLDDLAAAAGAAIAPDAVDLAIDAGALEERPGGLGFPHETVRVAMDSAIGPQERREAHLRIAASLSERASDDSESRVRAALHVLAAGGGDRRPVELGRLYEAAADAAMDRFARATALRLYEAALALPAYLVSLPGAARSPWQRGLTGIRRGRATCTTRPFSTSGAPATTAPGAWR